MAVIDIGSPAINRDDVGGATVTSINIDGTANGTGTITSIEIWVNEEITDCEIAIFKPMEAGQKFTTRSNVTLGTISSGEYSIENGNPIIIDSESNPISLEVQEGDHIGFYGTAGLIERSSAGYNGYYYKVGDYIPCTEAVFSLSANRTISLYGTGITEEDENNAIMMGTNF